MIGKADVVSAMDDLSDDEVAGIDPITQLVKLGMSRDAATQFFKDGDYSALAQVGRGVILGAKLMTPEKFNTGGA